MIKKEPYHCKGKYNTLKFQKHAIKSNDWCDVFKDLFNKWAYGITSANILCPHTISTSISLLLCVPFLFSQLIKDENINKNNVTRKTPLCISSSVQSKICIPQEKKKMLQQESGSNEERSYNHVNF